MLRLPCSVGRVIRLDGVCKRFGGRRGTGALRRLDLHLPAGARLGLVGPNGAGKSTLLALLLGYERADAGRIRVEGLEPRRWVRRHGAGSLPEVFRPPAGLRVGEALRRHARLDGFRGRVLAARVREVAARTGLERELDRRVETLSHGTRQRLGIAQLLIRPRRLLLLDEPFQGLDPVWRGRARALFRELAVDGAGVTVIASHDLGEVRALATEVLVLAAGRPRLRLGFPLPEPLEPAVLAALAVPEGA